jgi:hypothetical protein
MSTMSTLSCPQCRRTLRPVYQRDPLDYSKIDFDDPTPQFITCTARIVDYQCWDMLCDFHTDGFPLREDSQVLCCRYDHVPTFFTHLEVLLKYAKDIGMDVSQYRELKWHWHIDMVTGEWDCAWRILVNPPAKVNE